MKDTLIFSGGGVLGFAMLGALEILFQKYPQRSFKRFAGSSIGAVISTLLCRKTPSEIKNLYQNINIFENNDIDIDNLFLNYGLFDNSIVINCFTMVFDESITFHQLYKECGIHVVITGTNLSNRSNDLFCVKRTPHMKIIDALCISVNIPFLFQKFEYNNMVYADGSITKSLPYDVFNVPYKNIICLQIHSLSKQDNTSYDIKQHLVNIIFSLINSQKTNNLPVDTIDINCNSDLIVFNYDKKFIEEVHLNGINSASMYFKKRD